MPSLHDRLAAAVRAGQAPTGMPPGALRAALDAWAAWCAAEDRSPEALTPSAAAGFLDHRLDTTACRRSAFADFAAFQVTAALVWGAVAAAPLAATLRQARVTRKAPRVDGWGRAARAVALLPTLWRRPFEVLLVDSRTRARGAAVIWSAARIQAVATALRMYHEAAGPTAGMKPTAGAFTAWAEDMTAAGTAPMSVSAYLDRTLAGFETVLTPGIRHDGPAAIVNRWTARAQSEPRRRNQTARTVPASTLYELGLAMMAEALAAHSSDRGHLFHAIVGACSRASWAAVP